MRKQLRSVLVVLVLSACVSVATRADNKAGTLRAEELLKQARAAIGGAEKVSTVQSLTVKGKFRRVVQERDISGEREFNFLLPDKFMQTDSIFIGAIGDTVSNDRPAGVGRNSARGASRWDVGARLGWGFGFGGERKDTPMQGQPVIVRVGAEGGGIPSLPGVSKQRSHLDFYAQAFKLFNHANLNSFSGVQTSPFFGQPTAALPGRRIETGMRFSF